MPVRRRVNPQARRPGYNRIPSPPGRPLPRRMRRTAAARAPANPQRGRATRARSKSGPIRALGVTPRATPRRRANPQAGRATRARAKPMSGIGVGGRRIGPSIRRANPQATRRWRTPTRSATRNPQAGRALRRQARGVMRGRTPRTRR